jgi:hypothetical protein
MQAKRHQNIEERILTILIGQPKLLNFQFAECPKQIYCDLFLHGLVNQIHAYLLQIVFVFFA